MLSARPSWIVEVQLLRGPAPPVLPVLPVLPVCCAAGMWRGAGGGARPGMSEVLRQSWAAHWLASYIQATFRTPIHSSPFLFPTGMPTDSSLLSSASFVPEGVRSGSEGVECDLDDTQCAAKLFKMN